MFCSIVLLLVLHLRFFDVLFPEVISVAFDLAEAFLHASEISRDGVMDFLFVFRGWYKTCAD